MVTVTKIELYGVNDAGDVRGYDCASGTKIAKGVVLKGNDGRTATISAAARDPYAGVASADKAGDDNSTRVGAWQNGILEFTASETIAAFTKVVTGAVNGTILKATTADMSSSLHVVIGYTLKSSTNGTRVQVRVDN